MIARRGVEPESRYRPSLEEAPVGKANAKNASERGSCVVEQHPKFVGVGVRKRNLLSVGVDRSGLGLLLSSELTQKTYEAGVAKCRPPSGLKFLSSPLRIESTERGSIGARRIMGLAGISPATRLARSSRRRVPWNEGHYSSTTERAVRPERGSNGFQMLNGSDSDIESVGETVAVR